MKKFLLLTVLITTSVPGMAGPSVWSESGNWGLYNSKPDKTFNPMDIEFYRENFEQSAKYMISGFGKNNVANEFCIIGYEWSDKSRENKINVIWKDNYIINWEKPVSNDSGTNYLHSLMNAKPKVNLKDNVVPYDKIGAQTAAWAEEGVKEIMDDCLIKGIRVQIKPFKPDATWNTSNKRD